MQNNSAVELSERSSSDSGYAGGCDMRRNDSSLSLTGHSSTNVMEQSRLQVTSSIPAGRIKTPEIMSCGDISPKAASVIKEDDVQLTKLRRNSIQSISTSKHVRVPSYLIAGGGNATQALSRRSHNFNDQRHVGSAVNRNGSVMVKTMTGNGIVRKRDIRNNYPRRKSIDCTYHLLADGHESVIVSSNNRRRTLEYDSFTDGDHQRVLFPPLEEGNSKKSHLSTVDSNLPFHNDNRTRKYSGPERLGVRTSRSGSQINVKPKSPVPPRGASDNNSFRRRSLSGSGEISPEWKQYYPSASRSPVPCSPVHRLNDPSSVTRDQPKTFVFGSVKTNTLSGQSRSNTASSTRKQHYAHASEEAAGHVSASNDEIATENSGALQDRARSHSGRRVHRQIRSTGVNSPCSGHSIEKPPDGFRFNGKRRFSLPTTSILLNGNGLEKNSSPEFHKAFHELRSGSSLHHERRLSGEQRTSSARTSSSVHSHSEQQVPNAVPTVRRDLLHRIEEITADNPGTSTIGKNCEKTGSAHSEEVSEKRAMADNSNAASDKLLPAGELSADQNEISQVALNPIDYEDSKESRHAVVAIKSRTNEVPVTNKEKSSPSQSVFVVPPPGSSRKVPSRLEHTKEISRNEVNRHFIAGELAHQVDEDAESSDELSIEDDNCIDTSVLHIPDDDLCDEDLRQKRILLWLMQVKTGNSAEEIVRETPPPSPELNKGNAIIFVHKEN